ncbi:hypothetical protein EVG20_g6771 [Dentipellis fragilis]|uniref:Uncharacterized protein n=1 Tax=Dentipellis fragilis TaxID=205917 RepID=A0A4Y9YKK3_9AGAM|nr:hypothetical protein EVG20_g6771 [Dentipellis fragilis]
MTISRVQAGAGGRPDRVARQALVAANAGRLAPQINICGNLEISVTLVPPGLNSARRPPPRAFTSPRTSAQDCGNNRDMYSVEKALLIFRHFGPPEIECTTSTNN